VGAVVMKRFIYDTNKAIRKMSHEDVGKKFQELPEGKRYKIEVTEIKVIHSIPQSAYFHVLCSIFAIHTGHTLQEIKDEFKKDRFFEIIVDKQGQEFKRLKSTSKLNVTEYASVINNILQWGREKWPECVVKRKEDMDYLQWMEFEAAVKNEYNKTFSGW
jgi:hypothetical protein